MCCCSAISPFNKGENGKEYVTQVRCAFHCFLLMQFAEKAWEITHFELKIDHCEVQNQLLRGPNSLVFGCKIAHFGV